MKPTIRSLRPLPPLLGAVLALALVATAFPSAASYGRQEPALQVLRELALPEEVSEASDVRWLADDRLLVGVGGQGIYSWTIASNEVQLVATLAGSGLVGIGRYQDYSRLGGVSANDGISFAGRLFGVYLWDAAEISLLKRIESVEDVDRQNGHTAVLGLARAKQGEPVWEDYIAWLLDDQQGVRGLLPTRDDGQGLDYCGFAELGVVRFLSDGRLLVIPGAEPGVFLYDSDGMLREGFDASAFFADEGCGVAGVGQATLLGQAQHGGAWLSRRRLIDEVVADDEGNVFFFVRHVPEPASPPELVSAPTDSLGTVSRITVIDGSSGEATKIIGGRNAEELVARLREHGVVPKDTPVIVEDESFFDEMVTVSEESSSPQGRVCWDLVHTSTEDFGASSLRPCAIESNLLDTRLRADTRGELTVVLLRGPLGLATRDSQVLEVTLSAPSK